MDIGKLIVESGLENIKEGLIDFKGESYSYVRCRRFSDILKTRFFSEFFMIYLSDEYIAKIFFDKNSNNFHQFQSSLLSSTFFYYKNDIRWNMYLIILVDDNSSAVKEIDVHEIENDDNYARKYILTYDEALSFLRRKGNFSRNKKIMDDDFEKHHYQEWVRILNEVKLTGCLTESRLLDKYVEQYLDGEPFQDQAIIKNNGAPANSSRQCRISVPDFINEVDMGEFRSHCFKKGQRIPLAKVNLVHGTNGCGKTSLMEAIEFGITNEIRRMKDFGEDMANLPTVKVTCTSNGNNITLRSGRAPAEYKALDQAWYGVPTGLGKSTLNRSFCRFNYFDADAAYKFALDESLDEGDKKFNYRDRFKKLFYGEELLSLEKNWMRFRDGFVKSRNRLDNNYNENKTLIKNKEIAIKAFNNSSDLNFSEFCILLSDIKLKEQKISRSYFFG